MGAFTVIAEDGTPDEAVEALIRQRADAKKAKNFAEADRIREMCIRDSYKRLSDALLRRGFSWGEVKTALRTAGAALTDADDGLSLIHI